MPEGSQGSPAQPVAWYTLPVDEAFERLQAVAAQGLTQAEAVRRLAQFGPFHIGCLGRHAIVGHRHLRPPGSA